jgi:hypothetical protein
VILIRAIDTLFPALLADFCLRFLHVAYARQFAGPIRRAAGVRAGRFSVGCTP